MTRHRKFERIPPSRAASLADELDGNGDKYLFLTNDLRDAAEGKDIDVYSADGMYIAAFPASAVIVNSSGRAADCDDAAFIMSLEKHALVAPENTMLPLLHLLPGYSPELRHMMTVKEGDFRKKERDMRLKVLRTRSDFKSLFSLYRKIPEMMDSFPEEDDDENAASFSTRPFPFAAVALFEGGEAVSGAYISNPSGRNAMVSGVSTAPGYRGRGYAASVVSELLDIAFGENGMKRLSLWYTDEGAGRIYRSLGFRDTGSWIYLLKEDMG